jgi:hypothetical protein
VARLVFLWQQGLQDECDAIRQKLSSPQDEKDNALKLREERAIRRDHFSTVVGKLPAAVENIRPASRPPSFVFRAKLSTAVHFCSRNRLSCVARADCTERLSPVGVCSSGPKDSLLQSLLATAFNAGRLAVLFTRHQSSSRAPISTPCFTSSHRTTHT